MKKLKDDELDENLWDEPIVSSTQEDLVITPRVIDRFIHLLIDSIAAFILYWIGYMLFLLGYSLFNQNVNFEDNTINVINLLITYIIMTILSEGATGRTLGKVLTNYTVLQENNEPINFTHAFLRGICKLIPFGFFGLFLRTDQRMIHDVLPKTKLVLSKPKLPSQDDVIFDDPA
ncbi:MAG: RDD family protein [Flavobacteriaceae bacterium]|nr:RDD family protein [Flavobacteriaceae bacterium]MDG1779844.1 RDD family protein [Flavobacteriales bacterium]MDG2246986.1 RDD family protein [Flavobacteriales bacterium]